MSEEFGELLRRTLQNQTRLLEENERLRRERDEARAAARRVYGYLDMRLLGNSLIRQDLLKHWPWLREVKDD